MGKHYEISVQELKILGKYLKSYAEAAFKSVERNFIINQALKDLNDAGFTRWDHKKVIVYYNNNKKTIKNLDHPQQPLSQSESPFKKSNIPLPPSQSQDDPTHDNNDYLVYPVMSNFEYDLNSLLFQADLQQISENVQPSTNSPLNTPQYHDTNDQVCIENTDRNNSIPILIQTQNNDSNINNDNYSAYVNTNHNSNRNQSNKNSSDQNKIEKNHFSKSDENQSSELTNRNNSPNDKSVPLNTPDSASVDSSQEIVCLSPPYSRPPEPANLDELALQLPEAKAIDPVINETKYDSIKYDLIQGIQKCYQVIHKGVSYFHEHCVESEEKLKFQKKVEKKIVPILNNLKSLQPYKCIYSHDHKVERVKAPKLYRVISDNTRRYNNDNISPINSSETAKIIKIEVMKETDITAADNSQQIRNGHTSLQQDNILTKYTKTFEISTIKEHHHSNPKLENFFNGKTDKSHLKIDELRSIQSSTIVSYHLNKMNNESNDFVVCEIAYVFYDYSKSSSILHFHSLDIEIKSLSRIVTMCFRRRQGANKIYVCGDQIIKEFTIVGFDEFILSDSKSFEIEETNSFRFDTNSIITSAVMTVWDTELVLGSGKNLYFWDINSIKSKNTSKIRINKIENITSLEPIEKKGLMAVASKKYQVIYIYDKSHKNVSRLISHCMGVTSLHTFQSKLFSGSSDMNVRIWNIDDGIPELDFFTQCVKIKSIEIGRYLGQLFLFVADKSRIQCYNITEKKYLFNIDLFDYVIPKKMCFVSGENEMVGDYAKLVILLEYYKDPGYKMKINDLVLTIEFV